MIRFVDEDDDRYMPKMANICDFCLKSGILCSKCQTKLKSGKVTDVDLKVGRLLLSLENKYPTLQDMRFHKAIEANDILAVIVGRGDVARLLSYGGKIVREMGEKIGKTIHVLEHGVDNRKFLEDLFAPLNIVTINTIWIPDGTTETRVILKKRRRKLTLIKMEALKEIAKKVRGITIRVEFAR
ncbi:MAG: hypothetical protein JSV12_04165 [Candidatus Bathyarchaeota archaeon]|nr:MAG: hypothetical protein JSV12_04165 [Candidatus Bathyarchaeota archaeon]